MNSPGRGRRVQVEKTESEEQAKDVVSGAGPEAPGAQCLGILKELPGHTLAATLRFNNEVTDEHDHLGTTTLDQGAGRRHLLPENQCPLNLPGPTV